MQFSDLADPVNDIPLPDVAADARFNGPFGVEQYIATLIPHCVRVETRLNVEGAAADVNFKPTARFGSITPAETYDASDGAKPISVKHELVWFLDLLQGIGAPPPPPPIPVITAIDPVDTAQTGAVVTLTGENFTGATEVRIENGPVATVSSVTATEIQCTFAADGTGRIQITTPNGIGFSAGDYTITIPAQP